MAGPVSTGPAIGESRTEAGRLPGAALPGQARESDAATAGRTPVRSRCPFLWWASKWPLRAAT